MDWQTKEYIDEKFESIEDTLELILEKLGVEEDKDTNSEEEVEQTDSELDIEL